MTVVEPEVFISHASGDREFVEFLIDLLRKALAIPKKRIRCTAVGGHRIPAGANIDETLRNEICLAGVLIGVLSRDALASQYVLFELGARWGQKSPLVLLLTPGTEASLLKPPVSNLQILKAEEESDLVQLVVEVGAAISFQGPPATLLEAELRRISGWRDAKPPPQAPSKLSDPQSVTKEQDRVLEGIAEAENAGRLATTGWLADFCALKVARCRYALEGLKRGGLIELDAERDRWILTQLGRQKLFER